MPPSTARSGSAPGSNRPSGDEACRPRGKRSRWYRGGESARRAEGPRPRTPHLRRIDRGRRDSSPAKRERTRVPPHPILDARAPSRRATPRDCQHQARPPARLAPGERYSAPGQKRRLAVKALDDDDVGGRVGLPTLDVLLIFGRAVAGLRGRQIGKLDHHVARACGAFHAFEWPAAHDQLGAEFLEDRTVGRDVGLVALLVLHIDATDPVTLRHLLLPTLALPVRSRRRWHPPHSSDRQSVSGIKGPVDGTCLLGTSLLVPESVPPMTARPPRRIQRLPRDADEASSYQLIDSSPADRHAVSASDVGRISVADAHQHLAPLGVNRISMVYCAIP